MIAQNTITPFIEQRILDIVRQTPFRLSYIQSQRSIGRLVLNLSQRNEYFYDDKLNYIDTEYTSTRVYKVDNLPITTLNNHAKPYEMSILNAINSNYILPILITKVTDSGDEIAVPWDEILIIKNEYDDMFIKMEDVSGYDPSTDFGCVFIPYGIVYRTDMYPSYYPKVGFLFDEDGRAVLDPNDYLDIRMAISVKSSDIKYSRFNFADGTAGFILDMPIGEEILPQSLIGYKDGYIVTDMSKYVHMIRPNTFLFIEPETCGDLVIDAFYFNRNMNKSITHIYNADKSGIILYLSLSLQGQSSEFIDKLFEETDLYNQWISVTNNVNRYGTYMKARKARYESIIGYNKRLLFTEDVGSQYNLDNLKVDHISGKTFRLIEDEDGISTIPLRRWKNENGVYSGTFKPIIFVNNKLYNKYYTLELLPNDSFRFDSSNISDDDRVEIYYIGKSEDVWEYKTYEINVPSDGKTIHSKWDVRNCMIFQKNPEPEGYPNVMNYEHGTMAYQIDFTCIKIADSDKYTITFEDESWYDQDLILVTKDQFLTYSDVSEYSDETGGGENINIILPEEFKYAHEIDHYLVFLNGRRLDNRFLEINIPKPDNPFHEISIYSSIIFEEGDRVDVIYLPFSISDIVQVASVDNTNGLITIDGQNLPFGLNKEDYLLFVNGNKVNNEDINIISDNVLQIRSMNASNDITLSLISMNPSQVEELFMTDAWNELIQSATDEQIASLYDAVNITDEDVNLRENETYKKAILLEIYKDYYGLHFNGLPLVYTTNEDLIDDEYVDADGIDIIDAANARSDTSVDFDHYYERYDEE